MGLQREIMPVLERAGLAFVAVHRHQARSRLLAHERPLATGREAGAAKPAQARVINALDNLVARTLA